MQRYGQFLEWKPSQIAAAATLLAINLNMSPITSQVGLRPLKGTMVKQLIDEHLNSDIIAELDRVFQA